MKPKITIITENLPYDQIGREFIHELSFIDKDAAWYLADKIGYKFNSYDKEIINTIIKYDKKYNVNFVEYKTNEDE